MTEVLRFLLLLVFYSIYNGNETYVLYLLLEKAFCYDTLLMLRDICIYQHILEVRIYSSCLLAPLR